MFNWKIFADCESPSIALDPRPSRTGGMRQISDNSGEKSKRYRNYQRQLRRLLISRRWMKCKFPRSIVRSRLHVKFQVLRNSFSIDKATGWCDPGQREQTQTEVSGYNGFNTCDGRSFCVNNNLRPPKQSWKFMMRIKPVDRKRLHADGRSEKDSSCTVLKYEKHFIKISDIHDWDYYYAQ